MSAGAYSVRNSLELTDQMKRSASDAVARDDSQSPILQHYRKASSGSNKIFATHSRNSSIEIRSSNVISGSSHHSREPSNISTGDSACADLDTSHLQSPLQPRLASLKVNLIMKLTVCNVGDNISVLTIVCWLIRVL